MAEFKKYPELKQKLIARGRGIGLNLNLDKPVTIQDKINWLKLYDSTPLKTRCADKIRIHDYCKEKLGVDLCIPIIRVFNKVEEIDWKSLPNQFVIKCNHGSGMNIIVRDKSKLNIRDTVAKLRKFMADDFAYHVGYEMHYHDIPHKIFVEEYKEDEGQKSSLYDYKFWCFNGTPRFMTITDGNGHGDMSFYDMEFRKMDIARTDFKEPKTSFKKPVNFEKMIEYSRKLSEDFLFVRVDFYEVSGKLYLGELTFTPGAGFMKFRDKKYDKIIGDMLSLDKKPKPDKRKIIVSMTSWPKRIGNVTAVLKSLLDQELVPDIIQLNLSKEEFPEREKDFPEELNSLIGENKKIEVEWLDGNDGVFKKIIPTIRKHYGEDYYLFSVDDDYIYRKDYIKRMVGYLEDRQGDSFCLHYPGIIGNRMIYRSTAFDKDFWEKLTDEVIKNRISDAYIFHYLKSKGKKMTGFRPDDTAEMMRVFNPVFPNSHNPATGQYSKEDTTRAINEINKISF